jgi:hypothetical protein
MIKTPVQLIDLFPTLCRLIEIDKPDGIDGIDLSNEILGTGKIHEDRPVFCDNMVPRWGGRNGIPYDSLKGIQICYFQKCTTPDV